MRRLSVSLLLVLWMTQTTWAGNRFSPKLPKDLPPCGHDPAQGREDLDGNGTTGCWEACWHGGSGFGGIRLLLRRDCGKRALAIDTFGSFGDMLSAFSIPDEIAESPKLLRSAIDLLFGSGQLRRLEQDNRLDPPVAEGSFLWLVDWYSLPGLPKTVPFEEIRIYRPIWREGSPEPPPSQVARLRHPLHLRMINLASDRNPSGKPAAPESGLAAYYAHNHGKLQSIARCRRFTLFASKHGVSVFDSQERRSSWVFVSTGVVKLRWPSVLRAACGGGLVAVERDPQAGGHHELWVINPQSGRLGRLRLGENERFRFDQAEKSLLVSDRKIPLIDLMSGLAPPKDWRQRFDLDGDGRADTIEASFSGGAHCCYQIAVTLTSTGMRHAFPFELDGGYGGGLDLSQPYRFNLADFDRDGLPELMLEIATYNGEPLPIPPDWSRRFGVNRRWVLLGFKGGRARVSNL